ncbi:hypothetical protein SeseC_01991 [Streptococcus equi subsp. zooepidemicus ATCC 35246]|nr:hypothetical protein SeseC_01991 [Streptococcus equi subsp. zooepidemicus ATCC 35246]AIA68558.1 hypothetical protein Q426_01445 [Streptococcus equi subsp. zooepidemicus CY]
MAFLVLSDTGLAPDDAELLQWLSISCFFHSEGGCLQACFVYLSLILDDDRQL